MNRIPVVVLMSGLLMGLTACPPPCPQTKQPRCVACGPGVQRPPTKKPDCAEMCTYFAYCRSRRWTSPKHMAKLILGCTTQCKAVKPATDGHKIFDGMKTCSVNRSCVDLLECLGALDAKIQAAKPKIDPNAIYKVDLAGSPTLGPADALVTVVMFADHECGFCRRAHAVLQAALKKHPKLLRLVYKHYPLSDHSAGKLSGQASNCVRKQKGLAAFWTFHDKAMTAAGLSLPELLTMAKDAGADPKAVAQCLKDKKGLDAVKADLAQGTILGIDGTPTFYINGKRYSGYLDTAGMAAAIADAKGRAEAAVKAGTKAAQVYQHLTGKGATKLQYLPPSRPAPRPRK